MKRKKNIKNEEKQQIVSHLNLKAGMVFEKYNHVYTKQMIISDKVIPTMSGVYRECIAWNNEICKRYDTTEAELLNSKQLSFYDTELLSELVLKGKKTHWNDVPMPQI